MKKPRARSVARPQFKFKTLWTGYDEWSELRLRAARHGGSRTLRLEARPSQQGVGCRRSWKLYSDGAPALLLGALADLLEAQQ